MRPIYALGAFLLALSIALWLAGCTSQPIEAQLATACNQAATALREAAILKANGKLSPSANDAIVAVIPSLEAGCDPASPPQNLTMDLANVSQALQTITLQNAGVK